MRSDGGLLAASCLSMLSLVTSYMPDDGTQGYTPYHYKMDVPVRVKNSISYGRAWQLLRSRGAGSNATGSCDPPQNANSCDCVDKKMLPPNPGVLDRDDVDLMPACLPSPLCGAANSPPASKKSGGAAIMLFIDMQRQNLRFPVGSCVPCLRRGYGKAVRELMRVLLSLRAVNTTLPVYILASGERYPAVEQKLVSLFPSVRFLADVAPPVVVPSWASKWARGSFAKLRALALTRFDRLVVLDNDDIVLRNIDHLVSHPAPAFVFGWKCYPRRELRASTMVLRPRMADWEAASRLVANDSAGVYDDLGEQSVWRRLYTQAYELPAGFAAMRTADLPGDEWPKVSVVHDAHLIHDVSRDGWHAAGMLTPITEVDKHATRLYNEHLFSQHFADPPPPKRRGKGKGKGKRRAHRM